jgi:hypothetical protein
MTKSIKALYRRSCKFWSSSSNYYFMITFQLELSQPQLWCIHTRCTSHIALNISSEQTLVNNNFTVTPNLLCLTCLSSMSSIIVLIHLPQFNSSQDIHKEHRPYYNRYILDKKHSVLAINHVQPNNSYLRVWSQACEQCAMRRGQGQRGKMLQRQQRKVCDT